MVAYILVFGTHGADKTAFIKQATGQEATSSLVTTKIDNQDIALIKVVSFAEDCRSDGETLDGLSSWLYRIHQLSVSFSACIVLQPVGENSRVVLLKKILGEKAYKNTIIVATDWESKDEMQMKARLFDYQNDSTIWSDAIAGGARMIKFDNNAQDIVRLAMHKKFRKSFKLQLLKELGDTKGNISMTSAAIQARSDMSVAITKLQKELRVLIENPNGDEGLELHDRITKMEKSRKMLDATTTKPLKVKTSDNTEKSSGSNALGAAVAGGIVGALLCNVM